MTDKEIAEQNEIIRATVGSTVHGLAIDNTDDLDRMGVFIEPPEYVCGLKKIEQWTYRTKPEGIRSGPGDLDLTIYSLRKYVRLAAQGNPSVLVLLFVPNEHIKYLGGEHPSFGLALRSLAPAIISKQAGHRFLGYMRAQRDRMLGRRGQARLPNRPELVEKYGYDVKFMAHAIRLGYQGIELLETSNLTLPMPTPARSKCLAIRRGEVSQEKALKWAERLEEDLEHWLTASKLPEHPDHDTINSTLIEMHQEHWEMNGYV